MKILDQVKEFHERFDAPVSDKPRLIDRDRFNLRVSLIEEEFNELIGAWQLNDLTEVADALADLQYVLIGTVLEFGLQDKFTEILDEVHRSNMSKACKTEQEAIATVKHYEQLNVKCSYYKTDFGFIAYRVLDGKALKSVNYSPANIKKILGFN